jgi:hypothetical protein
MVGSASNYSANKYLEHIVGKSSFTKPVVYIALMTATPDDEDSGVTIVEPDTSGTAYARLETSASDWETAENREISNAVQFTFPVATGDGWGTITHYGLVDHPTVGAGNLLAWFELDAHKLIEADDQLIFAIGDCDISFLPGGD